MALFGTSKKTIPLTATKHATTSECDVESFPKFC